MLKVGVEDDVRYYGVNNFDCIRPVVVRIDTVLDHRIFYNHLEGMDHISVTNMEEILAPATFQFSIALRFKWLAGRQQ